MNMFRVFVTLLLGVLSGGFGNLISLDLCQRNITEVRNEADILRNVTSSTLAIGLCDNDITKVDPEAFQAYEALEMLNFNGNQGLRFPSDGSRFLISQSLMRLDCERCGIIEIYKDTLEGVPNLKRINLRENRIETIDDNAFRTNRALQEVDLSGNKLTRIPGAIFLELKSLHSVDLSFNSMLAPHQDQSFLTSDYLKVLRCDECGFDVIYERTFSGLPQLEELYLRKNNIRHVENFALVSHKHLNTLMLQNNKIESINLNLLSISKLGLEGNSIKLDCSGADRVQLKLVSGVECIVTTTGETPKRMTSLVTETHVFTTDPMQLEEIPPSETKSVNSQEHSVVAQTTENEIVIGISDWYITSYLTIIYLASSGVLIFLLCVLWKMEKYDSDPAVNFYAEGVLNPSPIYKPIQ